MERRTHFETCFAWQYVFFQMASPQWASGRTWEQNVEGSFLRLVRIVIHTVGILFR